MVTPRDRVWIVALELMDNTNGFSSSDVSRTLRDVFDRDDVPSRKTVRNVLEAMADLGKLERVQGAGSRHTVYLPRRGE